jgi:hypothetical protein
MNSQPPMLWYDKRRRIELVKLWMRGPICRRKEERGGRIQQDLKAWRNSQEDPENN